MKQLFVYGFTENDLPALRAAIASPDGIARIFPDLVQDKEIATKLRAAIADIHENVIPSPGVREQALLLRGTQPGTAYGEMLRTLSMFRSFPLALMGKTYPRVLYDQGMAGLLTTLAVTPVFWYVGDSLRQLSQGKTPRDVTKPDTISYALLRSGAGGLYSDVVFGDYGSYGNSFQEWLLGPVGSMVGDTAKLSADSWKLATGEKDIGDIADETRTIAMRNMPFVNIFYIKTALDRMLMDGIMEGARPGWKEESDQRMRDKFGQERIF
jgi:hypothetical protein